MKKASSYFVAVPVVILLVFLSGFYIGRSTANHTTSVVALSSSTGTDPLPVSPVTTSGETQSTSKPIPSIVTPTAAAFPLDINSADHAALTTLPGIGDVLAGNIIAYREENGPFTQISQLLNVPGIGEKRLEAIQDLIYIGG